MRKHHRVPQARTLGSAAHEADPARADDAGKFGAGVFEAYATHYEAYATPFEESAVLWEARVKTRAGGEWLE